MRSNALDIIDAAGVDSNLPCEQAWLGNDGNPSASLRTCLRLLGTAIG